MITIQNLIIVVLLMIIAIIGFMIIWLIELDKKIKQDRKYIIFLKTKLNEMYNRKQVDVFDEFKGD